MVIMDIRYMWSEIDSPLCQVSYLIAAFKGVLTERYRSGATPLSWLSSGAPAYERMERETLS